MIKKKAAIDLSMNFIVMLVLSMMMFGLGITIVYNLVDKGRNITVPGNIEDQILEIFRTSGATVALPITKIDIQRKKSGILYVGIKNLTQADVNFEVYTTLNKFYNFNNEEVTQYADIPKITHLDGDHTKVKIDSRGFAIQPLFITIPRNTESGRYIYYLNVTQNGITYDTVKVFTIRVP
jgi:hypothetical protein